MCIAPIWVRKVHGEVPCGKCYECVKRRRNDWYIRCRIESMNRPYVYFTTLTYSQVDDVLRKRDIQLFLKRLRSYGIRTSYLIVGEYGERKGRPHWHALFFADVEIDVKLLIKAWQGGKECEPNTAGFVKHEKIRSKKSIRYIIKYLYKYVGTDPKFELLVSKNPAIGKSFLGSQVLYLTYRKTNITVDGRTTVLPRYYKRKFYDDYPEIKEEINSELAAKVAENTERELNELAALYPELAQWKLKKLLKELKHERNRFEQFKKGK